MDNLGGALFFLAAAAVGLAMYWSPTIVAWRRHHKDLMAIGLVNLVFGWTFFGWVIALVWALTGRTMTNTS